MSEITRRALLQSASAALIAGRPQTSAAQSAPAPDARNMIRFSLAGAGELVDNLGTSAGSRALEMYNGRAIIRVNGKGGESTIAVASKDLPAAFLRIA
jgi:hypothetical protein